MAENPTAADESSDAMPHVNSTDAAVATKVPVYVAQFSDGPVPRVSVVPGTLQVVAPLPVLLGCHQTTLNV